jgi:hypothetical protein
MASTAEISLDDLFYDYEDALDEDNKIDPVRVTSLYKEFTNEVTPVRLTPLPRGFFFPYQEQQCRYILQEGKDSLLGILDPGTGKTFIGAMISEMFRGYYNPSLPQDVRVEKLPAILRQYLTPTRTNIRRCVYLTVNHTLDREVMNTIPIIKNSSGLTKDDENWYLSRSFGTFLTPYTKLYNEQKNERMKQLLESGMNKNEAEQQAESYSMEQMAATFASQGSDTFYVVDEAHRLSGENLLHVQNGKNINYKLIHLMLKSVQRSKIIVFTATPINNNTNEIIPVLNLVLPRDEQLSLKDTNFDKMSDKEIKKLIEEKCGDKVFYVASNPTGIVPTYVGIKIPHTPFSYDPCYMEGKQLQQYLDAVNDRMIGYEVKRQDKGIELDEQDKVRDSLYTAETMTAMCYSPIIKITETIKGSIIERLKPTSIILPSNSDIIRRIAKETEAKTRSTMAKTRRTQEKYSGHVRELVDAQPYIFDVDRMASLGEYPENWMVDGPEGDNLRQRSIKYYNTIKELLDPVLGNVVFLIYFRFFVNGGLEAFVAICILNGLERYVDTLSDVVVGDRIVGLEKKKRFIVLTPSMKSATTRLWLNIVKHPDNANGEYIQMVVISPGMKIGISVFSVRRTIHTSPEWSPWGELQSIYRGLREGGAEAVLRSLGEWPDGEMVNLISLQCAMIPEDVAVTYPAKERKFMQDIKSGKRKHLTTLDEDMYAWMSDKYKRHFRVLGPLRNVAVACANNRERNGQGVVCRPSPEGELHVNSFNVLYGRRYVWALREYMKRILSRSREPIHLSDILNRTRDYNIPIQLYYRAIYELIEEKTVIMSEIGIPLYIGFDRELLFLQSEYSIKDGSTSEHDFLMSYYSNYIPITHSNIISQPTLSLTEENAAELTSIKELTALRKYIRTKYPSVEAQMVILETALEDTQKKGLFPLQWRTGEWSNVLQLYYVYWDYFTRPLEGNILIAHSFVSFWHEAGYPIVARLRNPSRYRYYAQLQKEWITTLERSNLVDLMKNVYSNDKIRELFAPIGDFPIAIETICDGQFRVVLRELDSGPGIRGRMIEAFSFLELVYVLVLLNWDFIPHATNTEEKRDNSDIEVELREEIELRYGEDAVEVEGIVISLANVLGGYDRKKLSLILRDEFDKLNKVVRS